MYTPTSDVAAEAFGLGRPVGDLIHVRSGDTETWRLDTTEGSYLVKGYLRGTGGQFTPGGLTDQLAVAMAFEGQAFEAGIDMAEPIPPVDPFLGWATRLDERLFRAFRWVDHRPVHTDDDIAGWLGPTMARVHQLKPVDEPGLPDWWRGPSWPRETWEE